MPITNCIQKLLNIKDENIQISDKVDQKVIQNVKHQVIYGKLSYQPNGCANCGTKNQSAADIIKNGSKTVTLKVTHINFQPVLLKLKKQRFYCKHCESTFVAETQLIDKHCRIANTIKSTIAMELREMQSMSLIAKHMNVSTNTVIRVLRQVGDKLKTHYHYLPQHLSIDEFKSVKNVSGAMSFICIDPVNHRLIDIVENRQQAYLISYFLRYPLASRQAVKTITMDMYSPYQAMIEMCFPNAEIIIDRFHIVQHLNRALNAVRIATMKNIRYTRPTDYRKLKKQWKLILKNEEDLDFENFYTHRLYEGQVTEKIMTDYMLSIDARLMWVHKCINNLKYDIAHHDFEKFWSDLQESKKYTLPRKVRTTMQTMEKYAEGIEKALKYTISNGVVEGFNNKIKLIKRSGYGYRNFSNLKARILISLKLVHNKPTKVRPLYFKEEQNENNINEVSKTAV